jgi:amino-acid N-acetyltransferase
MTQNTFAKAKTRDAEDADAPEIFNLISAAARHGLVLPRSISEIQTAIKGFIVAFNSETNETIGCVALRDYGDGLVEVRSLVVEPIKRGHGAGTFLVRQAVETARARGMHTVFTLTYRPHIFERVGFERVDKNMFPQKVWADCSRCSKRDHCDEIALVLRPESRVL